MKNFNVSYNISVETDMTFIDLKVNGAGHDLLKKLVARIDNYYDANGLSTIEIVGDTIEMSFVNENSPRDVVASVKDYVAFVLDNITR